MSYSFNVRAASKAAAIAAVAAKLDEVEASQPSHGLDKGPALATASAFIHTLADPEENQEISVSVNGALSWIGAWCDGHRVQHASVGVSAGLATKEGA